LDFAKSITKYDSAGRVEVAGYNINGHERYNTPFMWRNHGIWLWDEAYTRACYAQQEIIDALQWFVDLRQKHKVVDPDFLGWMDSFIAGKAYMVSTATWFTGWLEVNQPEINYGCRRMPTLTGEFPPCAGYGWPDPQSIVVPVTTPAERKAVAFDLIAFLHSNRDFLIDNALTLGSPPVTPQIADHPLILASESIRAVTPSTDWLIYNAQQGAPLAIQAENTEIYEAIFQVGRDVKESIFRAQEESDRLTKEYIDEVGRENFQVSEREYTHPELMRFGKCLI
jgi:ABC-type glycerol-3-phosphate transport system substrate-binding protein